MVYKKIITTVKILLIIKKIEIIDKKIFAVMDLNKNNKLL